MVLKVSPRIRTAVFALTTTLGAFLLFQVQPMTGKILLPSLGGAPSVWTTCLLFFQCVLLGGYTYAHLGMARLRPRTQGALHLSLVTAAALLLTLPWPPIRSPDGASDPTWTIISTLTRMIGLPYLILSSTSPLLQSWLVTASGQASPYWLFALSNMGSLLGLLTYPFFFEPAFGLAAQRSLWSASFVVFAIGCAACAACLPRAPRSDGLETFPDMEEPPGGAPAPGVRLLWFLLSASGSIMLMAITNRVCQDLAVAPLLWVAPLSVYLATFVLCFHSRRWYYRPLYLAALVFATLATYRLGEAEFRQGLTLLVLGYLLILFVSCMVCHGELVRLAPPARHLTLFYLTISAGGAFGGILVGVVAPRIFTDYLELPLGLQACMILLLTLAVREQDWSLLPGRRTPVLASVLLGTLWVAGSVLTCAVQGGGGSVLTRRSFFGVIRVLEEFKGAPHAHCLTFYNGRVLHGLQFLHPDRRRLPTTYYGPESGAGLVLAAAPASTRRIGVVGLGVGTLAAYGRPGDVFRFYEINPDVIDTARRLFRFVPDSAARVEIVPGDGRVVLEAEEAQHFDVLVLDAFSGASVPVHLLTVEAFRTYLRHLVPDGVILVHVSHHHLDLGSVVWAVSRHLGLAAASIDSEGDPLKGTSPAEYMLLTQNPDRFASGPIHGRDRSSRFATRPGDLWTDDRNDLYRILK